jgi:hypothetical protein
MKKQKKSGKYSQIFHKIIYVGFKKAFNKTIL